ncbi:MAG: D-alanyl-D-alanine dipeptidase [Mixta calida]|jgi:D-alanyl-D-alanine dipeptidase|uniref:D-alanyl-D-alanine dipeptidase n=1 Tax=Mixta calida TaxID=665913 RepID=A0ABN5HCY6_9GAMM|nr:MULTISPECIES: D-alanyl-D-alanine dipeptidase [Mixta]AIX72691.1 D-alanyl-D-alanine dipeptidase [Pantoea sp. PSNIH2]MDU3816938.1 D-alanyl-D-alanine dipeptidase [Pantoea sp.]POU52083.1 D-alanyl-D-alanine dipeptidase [Pantoea sp. PSNIH5]POU69582.1 D-alanyl-D-alanine dipeptidase [Pantoea sp. PSNIH4]POY69673.1 D-alanyl-D-alanine dipeptidase [Pantoea sp. PSNIH3]
MTQEAELVDLADLFPQLEIDLKYATPDNITGYAIYQEARCLLHPDAAKALARSVMVARLAGLTLVVYDAYRPQLAQQHLWLACPDPQYVVAVSLGSNHSRGTAIDVTLRDEAGHILDMGAGFDEMHPRSHLWNPEVPPAAQRNRLLLNAIMQAGGFVGINSEWWHFELPDSVRYPLLTDRFSCAALPSITTTHSL